MAPTPFIGIDFGTSKSTMAWFNPRTGQAEIIKNAEGEDKTPSAVYFGERETLVGRPAEDLLEDEEERRRVVLSVKRDLVSASLIALPGRRVRPLEVAATILAKLKRDAEELHFHRPVSRAVITYPAAFDYLQQDKILEAARLAGFAEVVLLEEPVAAALAYAQAGLRVGRNVLVYDLGAGTFDVAVLAREDDGGFRLAVEPKGMARCGGDDFDRALYDHCDQLAQERLGRPISLSGGIDLHFLRYCRQRKESLTAFEHCHFSTQLAAPDGAVQFKHTLDRATFEGLIEPYIDASVRLTGAVLKDGQAAGHPADTVVLIGGSSRLPIVQRRLAETLAGQQQPEKWDKRDVAVALGAAYHGQLLWGQAPPPPPKQAGEATTAQQDPATLAVPPAGERYRKAVTAAWSRKELDSAAVAKLSAEAGKLGLSPEQIAAIEQAVIGKTKEAALGPQRYRAEVAALAAGGALDAAAVARLAARAAELQLGPEEAVAIEREVLGRTKEQGVSAVEGYKTAVITTRGSGRWDALTVAGLAARASNLGLSPQQAAAVERAVLEGRTKEEVPAPPTPPPPKRGGPPLLQLAGGALAAVVAIALLVWRLLPAGPAPAVGTFYTASAALAGSWSPGQPPPAPAGTFPAGTSSIGVYFAYQHAKGGATQVQVVVRTGQGRTAWQSGVIALQGGDSAELAVMGDRPLPPGSYVADLLLDGKPARSARFTIAAPPPTATATPRPTVAPMATVVVSNLYPTTMAAYDNWPRTNYAPPPQVTSFPAGTNEVAIYFTYIGGDNATTFDLKVYDASGTLVGEPGTSTTLPPAPGGLPEMVGVTRSTREAYAPGTYRADLIIDRSVARSTTFTVQPPPAATATPQATTLPTPQDGVTITSLYPTTKAAYDNWVQTHYKALPPRVSTFPAGTKVVAFYFGYAGGNSATTFAVKIFDSGGTLEQQWGNKLPPGNPGAAEGVYISADGNKGYATGANQADLLIDGTVVRSTTFAVQPSLPTDTATPVPSDTDTPVPTATQMPTATSGTSSGVTVSTFYTSTKAEYDAWVPKSNPPPPRQVSTYLAGTTVVAVYYAYNGATPSKTRFDEIIYDEALNKVDQRTVTAQYANGLQMSLLKPGNQTTFPVGNYRVDLLVDGHKAASTTFTVGS